MTLAKLTRQLAAVFGERDDMTLTSEPLAYRCGRYELLKAASRAIAPGDPVMLIAAGVHGDERSGPLTLASHGEAIVAGAHARGVKLVVYPLRNPSGYDRGLRYNADHDMGEGGNNDFLRYELEDGRIADSLPVGASFRRWRWSSDPELGARLPLETLAMQRRLREDPIGQMAAAIDLHQDHLTPGAPPGAYHYAFGDLGAYRPIVSRIERRCPLLASTAIGAGFGTRIDAAGRVLGEPSPERAMRSDAAGFIARHDGTLSDLLYRHGVRHSIAAETTGATPMDLAVEVNRIWIEGLLDLAAQSRVSG